MLSVRILQTRGSDYSLIWRVGYTRGVMQPPIDQLTSDGYDLQFGTNVLGELLSPSPSLHVTSLSTSVVTVYST